MRGSYPSVCSTSGAVQTLMLKNKDVENKEGEEQSCSSFQLGRKAHVKSEKFE